MATKETIARAPYGDFLVALGSALDRRAPGWASGYPYAIATGPGTQAKLFHPHTDEEMNEAIAVLGPTLPVYRLEVDRERFDREGVRMRGGVLGSGGIGEGEDVGGKVFV